MENSYKKGCMVCNGNGTCLYCGNIDTKLKQSESELKMIDVLNNGGKIVHMSYNVRQKIDINEITRDQIEDLGTLMITLAFDVSKYCYPFRSDLGNYETLLSKHLTDSQRLGRIIATPIKISVDDKYFTKIVAFEVIENGSSEEN